MPETSQTPNQPEAKLVPEKDLLAIKSAKESLEQKIAELTKNHEATLSTQKKSLDELTNKLFAAEANLKALDEKLANSSKDSAAYSEAKTKLDDATKKLGDMGNKVLDYRKQLLTLNFKIQPKALEGKSIEQLDLFEDALKAVGGVAGTGSFAPPGNTATPAQLKPRERIVA
jgi:septation ring formation regulator EzrA